MLAPSFGDSDRLHVADSFPLDSTSLTCSSRKRKRSSNDDVSLEQRTEIFGEGALVMQPYTLLDDLKAQDSSNHPGSVTEELDSSSGWFKSDFVPCSWSLEHENVRGALSSLDVAVFDDWASLSLFNSDSPSMGSPSELRPRSSPAYDH